MCHFLHHAYKVITFSSVMRGSRKLCQRGSNSNNVFFVFDEGKEDPNITTSRPSSAFKWCFAGGPMMAQHKCWLCDFQGIQTSIAKKPYIFVIFQVEGSGPPAPPPLDPHMSVSTVFEGSDKILDSRFAGYVSISYASYCHFLICNQH